MEVKTYKKLSDVESIHQILFTSDNRSSYQSLPVWRELSTLPYLLRYGSKVHFAVVIEGEKPTCLIAYRIRHNAAFVLGSEMGLTYVNVVHNITSEDMLSNAFSAFIYDMKSKDVTQIIWGNNLEGSMANRVLAKLHLEKLKKTVLQSKGVTIEVPQNELRFDDYVRKLSKNTRQNLRTAKNRLERDDVQQRFATFNLGCFYSKSLSSKERHAINRIYAKRLRQYYGYGTIRAFLKESFLDPACSIRNKSLRFDAVLYLNNQPAAALIGWKEPWRKTVVVPKLAIDKDFEFYSPGMLLIEELVQVLSELGEYERLDLGKGVEPYKTRMGGKPYELSSYKFVLQ